MDDLEELCLPDSACLAVDTAVGTLGLYIAGDPALSAPPPSFSWIEGKATEEEGGSGDNEM